MYIGASLGHADIRAQNEHAGPLEPPTIIGFDEPHAGWQLLAGLRPVPVVGVELAYLHLGEASAPDPFCPCASRNTRQSAAAAFGVAYLPLSSRVFDLYGKVGVARLHTDIGNAYHPLPIDTGLVVPANVWSTNLAYGAGTQARLGAVSLRLEYERISARGGDPDFLSIGVIWNF
jgi:hypothetical protein